MTTATYEWASPTCMQAVGALSVSLTLATISAGQRNMVDCSAMLMQAARFADFLKEPVLWRKIKDVHTNAFGPEEAKPTMETLHNACKALETAWREVLRENPTRYQPSPPRGHPVGTAA